MASNNTQTMQYRPRSRHIEWQDGDIAFLRSHESFTDDEYNILIGKGPGRVAIGATRHPVIIVKRCPHQKRSIITTVSAYASEERRHLAPWQQSAHSRKRPQDFRAFLGSQLPPGSGRAPLTLASPHMAMPKPQASWVYVQSVSVVPDSVLVVFHKSRTHLRVSRESLEDLLGHMVESCSSMRWCLKELEPPSGPGGGYGATPLAIDTPRALPAADIPAAENTKAWDAPNWRGATWSMVAAKKRETSTSSTTSTSTSASTSSLSSRNSATSTATTATTDTETEPTGSEDSAPTARPNYKAEWSAIVKPPSKATSTTVANTTTTTTHLAAAATPAATATTAITATPVRSWVSIAGRQAQPQPLSPSPTQKAKKGKLALHKTARH